MATATCTCTLCEAMCGLRLQVEDGRVVSVRGDPDDPFSRGHICPKASALPDIQDDPERLRHPLKRTDAGFVQVSWDEALDDIAQRIHALQGSHGRDSVGAYLGNPNVHNLGCMLYLPDLLRTLGGRSKFSATSVDQLPHMLAAAEMFGHELLMPVPDVDRTDLMVILGGNPLVSNGSIMTAPGIRRRLDAVRERGRVVVIDPRRTETALRADAHHFIRPGTDALLLLGLLHVIVQERGIQLHHLGGHVDGIEVIQRIAGLVVLDSVAGRTGIGADVIRELALDLADTERAVLYGRLGTCAQRGGGVAAWLVNLVNAVAGNLDRPGGLMVTRPAFDALFPPGSGRPRARKRFGRWHSRVRGLPEFAGELPVSVLAEEIETPGEGQVRGLLVWAGNPVLTTPNGRRLEGALRSLDLLVSVDLYLTETARLAHYVLPAVPPLARDHYDAAFHVLAVRNTARFSPAVVEPDPDTRHDWQIACGLAERLLRLRKAPLRQRATWMVKRRMGPRGQLAIGLRMGPWPSMSLRRLRAAPSGVDLGPLESCLLQRSPRERLDLAPEALVEDVPRLLEEEGPEGLLLIGRRDLRSANSWLHNHARLMKGADRCTLLVHPDDASALGLVEGGHAVVTSRVGQVRVPVHVSDEVMPGVVSLPHGWGHDRDGVGWSTAVAHPGASVNDLTDEQQVDPLSGNAILNGVPVQVTAAAGQ